MKFPSWLRVATWTLVVALGVGAIGVLAWSRGEPVSALWIVVAANARVWWQLLAGRRGADLREEAYVPLAPARAVK